MSAGRPSTSDIGESDERVDRMRREKAVPHESARREEYVREVDRP